jgi:hypothetical protein
MYNQPAASAFVRKQKSADGLGHISKVRSSSGERTEYPHPIHFAARKTQDRASRAAQLFFTLLLFFWLSEHSSLQSVSVEQLR